MVEHIAPALAASYGVPAPTAFAAPAPVVEHISPDLATSRLRRWSLPKQLHEIDEEICRDDFEELSYVARMSRKRLWRRVWHGCSSPSGASKSERSWRRLSKRLCCEEGFDERCLRTKMTFWSVACVRLTVKYLGCSTDVARLLWATQEVHVAELSANNISCKACGCL